MAKKKLSTIIFEKLNYFSEVTSKLHKITENRNGKLESVYWPFMFEHECKPENCFKREDGLWEGKELISNHKVVFIWRIEPNYCVHGQPCFSEEQIAEIYKKSETEKLLYKENDLEFYWKWYKFELPNKNIWGLKPRGHSIEVRKNGVVVYKIPTSEIGFKKKFKAYCEELVTN
jgi:hypothetical protein